ncbi:MAG TPA: hypothetical protein VHV83_16230 [Armatimonadota bacterium]|nr:hypothetical protein [Armatimonadota bacterium]
MESQQQPMPDENKIESEVTPTMPVIPPPPAWQSTPKSTESFGYKFACFIVSFVATVFVDIVSIAASIATNTSNIMPIVAIAMLAINVCAFAILLRRRQRSTAFGIIAVPCFFLLAYGSCMMKLMN